MSLEKSDLSAKSKEYFSSKKPGHSKGEYRYFSAVREKRLVQQDKADRHTGDDPEMGKTEFLGGRGTSAPSIIPERDVCLFTKMTSIKVRIRVHDLEDLMVVAEAPEAFECDGLDTTATTEQHLRTLARSKVRIESPGESSVNSKFLNTSVGTQNVGGEFAMRNMTKLTDAAGQPTDEGREARPSEADEPVQSVELAGKDHETEEKQA